MPKRRSEAASTGQQETSGSEYERNDKYSDDSSGSSPARPVKRSCVSKGKQQQAAGSTKRRAKLQGGKKGTKKVKVKPAAARADQYGEARCAANLPQQVVAVALQQSKHAFIRAIGE
jgi:hypothetical protein